MATGQSLSPSGNGNGHNLCAIGGMRARRAERATIHAAPHGSNGPSGSCRWYVGNAHVHVATPHCMFNPCVCPPYVYAAMRGDRMGSEAQRVLSACAYLHTPARVPYNISWHMLITIVLQHGKAAG